MNSLPGNIYLSNPGVNAAGMDLLSAWGNVFGGAPEVEVCRADIFSFAADAVVSPANSFGYMDGGLDLHIRERFGMGIEAAVRKRIAGHPFGELLVGQAEVLPTGDANWPFLVCAPTMRVPENVSATVNAYLAFRAALRAVGEFNAARPAEAIRSLTCPGLGTGIGRIPAEKCAYQMLMAYKHVYQEGKLPTDIVGIPKVHRNLLMGATVNR